MPPEAAAAQQRRGRDRAGGDDDQRRRDPHLAAVRLLARPRPRPARPRPAPCVTCSPETIRAPASQACGSAFRWTPLLALLGQPIAHWQAPRQPGALRRSGAFFQSRAAAPSSESSPLRPSTLHRRRGDADRRFDVGDPAAEQLRVRRAPGRGFSNQSLATGERRPIAGAGVDHGRAADGTSQRQGDRRVAERHRRAAVAVDRGEAVERVGGRGCGQRSSARLPRRSRCRTRPAPARGRRRRRRRRSRSRPRRSALVAGHSVAGVRFDRAIRPRGLMARARRRRSPPRRYRRRGRAGRST